MSAREDNDNFPPVTGGEALDAPDGEAPPKRLGRETVELPKRFYSSVATASIERGFAVLLDGRPIKTPRKSQVIVPTLPLAEALAADWQAQTVRIDPATMPLTRIVNTTLDAVTPNLEAVRADLVAFAGSDALCYRASEPQALVEQQGQAWDPILAWAARDLKARFTTTGGIIHVEQPRETLAAFARAVAAYSPWEVAPIHVMTTLTGSAVMALALARQAISFEDAWAAAHVDEDWQIATWGEDEEARLRRAGRLREMQAAHRMLETLR